MCLTGRFTRRSIAPTSLASVVPSLFIFRPDTERCQRRSPGGPFHGRISNGLHWLRSCGSVLGPRCFQRRSLGRAATSRASSRATRENQRRCPLFICHYREQGSGNRAPNQRVCRSLGRIEDPLFFRTIPGSDPLHGSLAPFLEQVHREVVPIETD